MHKIPTLFKRAHDGDDTWRGPRPAIDEVRPGCEWVLEGLGRATEKVDGSACLLCDGKLYKRHARKPTKAAKKEREKFLKEADGNGAWFWDAEHYNAVPEGWFPTGDPAPRTGLWPGWKPINGDDPTDKWHVEAFNWLIEKATGKEALPKEATFELVGPKVQQNPYDLSSHQLWLHGDLDLPEFRPPIQGRTFTSIKQTLKGAVVEGVVFHCYDPKTGILKMAKLKRKDLGLKWPVPGRARSRELNAQEKLEQQLAKVNG